MSLPTQRRKIPITRGFGQNLEDLIGYIQLDVDGTIAPLVLSDLILAQSVFAPAYMQKEDGTIELLEFSLIPARDAKNLIERGMENAEATTKDT